MIELIAAIIGSILLNLIASELFAWGPRLSEWLMRRAVQRLAPEKQERFGEEWAGHLQAIPPELWRIRAAIGFLWAGYRIGVASRKQEQTEKAEAEFQSAVRCLAEVLDSFSQTDEATWLDDKTCWQEIAQKVIKAYDRYTRAKLHLAGLRP